MRPAKETVLTALPLYHVFAFTVDLLAFYRRGAHNVLIPSPRPLSNLKRALENYPVTWITGVNTLFDGLRRERWFVDHPVRVFWLPFGAVGLWFAFLLGGEVLWGWS